MLVAELDTLIYNEHIRIIKAFTFTVLFDSTVSGDFPPDLMMYTVRAIRPVTVKRKTPGHGYRAYNVLEIQVL